MFLFHAGYIVADNDDPLVLLHAAEVNDPIDFRDLGGVFRLAGFEEFGNARQTARDILRLDRSSR